jgi:hypothetical protein
MGSVPPRLEDGVVRRPTLSVRPSAGGHYPLGVIKVTPRPEQEHVRHFSVQCALGLQQAHFCEL